MHDAFDPVDPSGRMADECWRDVGRKLDRWRTKRAGIAEFVADWDRHRTELRALVATPDQLRTALTDAGAAAAIAELDPPATAATVRWALGALPLMRDRFTVADLRFLARDWDAETVDRLLDRSGIHGGRPMSRRAPTGCSVAMSSTLTGRCISATAFCREPPIPSPRSATTGHASHSSRTSRSMRRRHTRRS